MDTKSYTSESLLLISIIPSGSIIVFSKIRWEGYG
jgi:hypothetical protein